MAYLKLISKNIGIMALIILISSFFITLLNYFDILSGSFLSILKIIIMIVSFFTGGFLTGRNSNSKGWLEGLKLGVIFSSLLFIINIFLIKNFAFKNILYFIILIVSSIVGSMIGISKKRD